MLFCAMIEIQNILYVIKQKIKKKIKKNEIKLLIERELKNLIEAGEIKEELYDFYFNEIHDYFCNRMN